MPVLMPVVVLTPVRPRALRVAVALSDAIRGPRHAHLRRSNEVGGRSVRCAAPDRSARNEAGRRGDHPDWLDRDAPPAARCSSRVARCRSVAASAARCSLLVTRRSLLAARRSLRVSGSALVSRCSLLVSRCRLRVNRCSRCGSRRPLLVSRCSLLGRRTVFAAGHRHADTWRRRIIVDSARVAVSDADAAAGVTRRRRAMLDKRGRSRDALRFDGVAPHRIAVRAEAIARNHRPGVPRISKAGRQADHRSAVVTERAPADIARRRSPRDPSRGERTSRDPEPAAARVSPAAVMMRRPCPWFVADPRPPVRRIGRPVAVIVRPPAGRNRGWVPHAAVARFVLPRPVLIERGSVGL